MKLSDLFTGVSKGENHVAETGRRPQSQYARTAELNRQIHSLAPGQTIRGEIMSRNGNEVQIRLPDDMVMNAKVDQSINLELGKNVTFEVKSNGGTLSLSPLFTNIAADATVLKALEMASLPVNEITVSMTEQLMKAGLPVNKNTLQQIYREINSFPEGEVSDVVDLHRLKLPVNETTMQQMESYRNLTHQLIKGMTNILDALPEAVNGMLAEGNVRGAADLYREIISMIQEGAEQTTAPQEGGEEQTAAFSAQTAEEATLGEAAAGETAVEASAGKNVESVENGVYTPAAEDAARLLKELAQAGETVIQAAEPGTEDGKATVPGDSFHAAISDQDRAVLVRDMLQTLDGLQMSPEEKKALSEAIQRLGQGNLTKGDFFETAGRLLDAARHTAGGMQQLQRLFAGKEFNSVLISQLKEVWTLRPEEVAEPGKVEALYRRLDRQLKNLSQALETGGQGQSTAFRASVNLSQNVDFLNQLNQMYTYVQLPLHLQQSDAHGDLYVYTNKKSLADNDGKVSALLHLDMEHLGPVDVYVMLQETRVSTKFYVADDEILDFIEAHMDILTKRLEKRGYSCSISMTKRGEKEQEEGGGLAPLLGQEKGILLSQYAFDVRT